MRVYNAMNNIYVHYLGREISIAQHISNGITSVQEIADVSDLDNPIRYDKTLPSLIAALQELQNEIDKQIWGDKPSGESIATAAQSSAGSTAQEGQQTQT